MIPPWSRFGTRIRTLGRSPMTWVALALAAVGIAFTVAVGMDLYASTDVPLMFNNR